MRAHLRRHGGGSQSNNARTLADAGVKGAHAFVANNVAPIRGEKHGKKCPPALWPMIEQRIAGPTASAARGRCMEDTGRKCSIGTHPSSLYCATAGGRLRALLWGKTTSPGTHWLCITSSPIRDFCTISAGRSLITPAPAFRAHCRLSPRPPPPCHGALRTGEWCGEVRVGRPALPCHYAAERLARAARVGRGGGQVGRRCLCARGQPERPGRDSGLGALFGGEWRGACAPAARAGGSCLRDPHCLGPGSTCCSWGRRSTRTRTASPRS